jgi:zinc protease
VAQRQLAPLRIRHTTHCLGNGLQVVVHEDHTCPVVAVHLMYHVGSKDERPGRTGLAHLLEHLLFEGSLNCPKGEFDRILERTGGTNNGSTWLDRTNYYEVVPSSALEVALWLERDRMGFFLPVLDEEMLEIQRGVVINERRQSYENRPYGMADERLQQLLFPGDHPYSWPTIGYLQDLEAITLDDVRDFFSRFYTPRNAVLVLAGDVEADQGFRLAERYFGDLDGGPALPRGEPPKCRRGDPERSDTLTDRVSFPRLYRAHSVPGYGTREWVALDVLSYLLSDGESSQFQRRLVRDRQLAQEVDAFLYPTELCGIFGVVGTTRTGVDPDELEGGIDQVVTEVAEGRFTPEEVEGAIRRARRDQLGGLSKVEERAEELAYAVTVLGAAYALDDVLDLYSAVTPRDVRDAAARFLNRRDAARLRVVPDGRSPLQGEDADDEGF